MLACAPMDPDAGVVRGVLETISCHSRFYAQSGYEALAAPNSPFQGWLTAFLVIYVAVLGYRLLLGSGSRMGDLPLTALKIGAVLALATNWSLFQTLVFDLVWKEPVEVARIVSAPAAANSTFAGDPIGGLQVAYDTLSKSSEAFGRLAGPATNVFASSNLAAAQALRQSSQAIYIGTVGLFGVSMVAAAVLTAIGPIFVTLFLFSATRGIFFGWVRALLATMLTPLLGWVATVLMLLVLEPNLIVLAQQLKMGPLNPDTAFATSALVLVFALVQIALTAAGVIMALGFSLKSRRRAPEARAPEPLPDLAAANLRAGRESLSRAEGLAAALNRPSPAGDQTRTVFERTSWLRPTSAAAGAFGAPALAMATGTRRPQVRSRGDFGQGGRR